VFVLSLAGCGGGQASGNTQLEMMWYGSQDTKKRNMKAIELLEQKHPDLSFEAVPTTYDAYWDKLATQVAGGNAPDLIAMDQIYLVEYAKRGALLGLNQFSPGTIKREGFDEDVMQGGMAEGDLYGFPRGVKVQTVYYDATMLDKIGIEMPDPSWNWDDFARVTNDISKAAGEDYFGTEDASGQADVLSVYLTSRGKTMYSEAGKLGFEKSDLTEWFGYWDDLRSSGAAAPGDVQSPSQVSPETYLVVKGRAAFELGASDLLLGMQAATQNELKMHTMPDQLSGPVRPGGYKFTTSYISGSARTDYPEEVATVINSLVNDTEIVKAYGLEFGVPTSPKVDASEAAASPEEKKIVAYTKLASESVSPTPPPPPQGATEVVEVLTRVSEDVSFGRKSIDEAVNEFFSEAEGRIL
jgi:multiple sugar transport system substrate-binding protein